MSYTPITDKRILLSIFTVIILIAASFGVLYLTDNLGIRDKPDDREGNNGTTEPVSINTDFNLTKTKYFKGEKLLANLKVTVDKNITLLGLSVSIRDNIDNRTGNQLKRMNETLLPGTSELDLILNPSFPYNGFVVIRNRSYTMFQYEIIYKYLNSTASHSEEIHLALQGQFYMLVDQMKSTNWTIQTSGNFSYTEDENGYIIEGNNSSAVFTTQIQTTGYTSVDIFTSGGIGDDFLGNINYEIGNVSGSFLFGLINPDSWSNFDSIPIGNLQGKQNLTISLYLNVTSNFRLNFTSYTHKLPLYAVIASNNWQGIGEDGLIFQPEEYYLQQVSDRFEETFNVTIIPVAKVEFEFENSTDLFEIVEVARKAVGENLTLTNNEWTATTGSSKENFGADILIVFTNKTMDHLGAVIGTPDPLNMGIHARGTLFTGDYRLLPSFADNLIQHELSHIFGAPDRWTDTSDPSVMTKSKPDDAFNDFFIGEFWLSLTNWLESDIQTMAYYLQIYANSQK